MSWTNEAVTLLTKSYADGASFGRIEEDMKRAGFRHSRNACIGKAHRLGLKPRKETTDTVERRVSSRRKRSRSAPRGPKPQLVLSPVPVPGTPPPRPVLITTDHIVEFMKAGPYQCRYPLWGDDECPTNEKWYCGAPANVEGGEPYCSGHAHIVFTPLRTRSEANANA